MRLSYYQVRHIANILLPSTTRDLHSFRYLLPPSTNPRLRVYNNPSSIQDVYGLYPPRRRGTGGHHERRTDWRTSPENYCRVSSRKETSTSTHHLPDRLRLRQRPSGRRGLYRHRSRGRLFSHDHAWLSGYAFGHSRRNASPHTGCPARRETCAARRRHALRLLPHWRGRCGAQRGPLYEGSWRRSGKDRRRRETGRPDPPRDRR